VSRTAFVRDIVIIFGIGLALFLLLSSLRRRIKGPRLGRFALTPLAVGIVLSIGLLVVVGERLIPLALAIVEGNFATSAPQFAIPFAIGILAIAAVLGEVALVMYPERFEEWRLTKGVRNIGAISSASLTALSAVFILAVTVAVGVDEGTDDVAASIEFDAPLPGPPMDYEAIDQLTGYMTLATGEIVHISLPTNPEDPPRFETVADGLTFPRGLAVIDDVLYVADLDRLACPTPFPTCFGHDVEGEKAIISQSSGVLLAYPILPDGALGDQSVVLTDLPVVSSEHAVNDVEVGPDGALYVSIGHIDWLWEAPEELADIEQPNLGYLGTIIRVDPATREVVIHASGLRNVFGFDFDDNGRIFATDNDGPTTRGFYREAVLFIDEGDYFGYPEGGGSPAVPGAKAGLWYPDLRGTADTEWIDGTDTSHALLIGGLERLSYFALGEQDGVPFVPSGQPLVDLLTPAGYVSVVEELPDERILVATTGIYGGTDNRLLVLSPIAPPE
jgi:hypothetical protein